MMADSQQILSLKRVYGAARGSLVVRGSLSLDFLLGSDSAQFQDELVSELMLAPHFRDFPPSREFRRLFWKYIVEYLEKAGEEVDERIYEAYLDLLSAKSSSFEIRPPSPSYNTHFWSAPPDDNTQPQCCMRLTTLLESSTMIEGGTTGLRTWGASLEFANWLVRHPEVVQNRKVLELGSGAGFLGLVMAALQMDRTYTTTRTALVLSDVNPEVLSRCRQNFHLPCNRMVRHPSLDFRLLDWSDALDNNNNNLNSNSPIMETLNGVDTIIGTDLVYDVSIVPALVAVLVLFFRSEQNRMDRLTPSEIHAPCAYIATTVRREETVSVFISTLSHYHLKYEEIDMDTLNNSQKQFLDGTGDTAHCNVTLIKVTSLATP